MNYTATQIWLANCNLLHAPDLGVLEILKHNQSFAQQHVFTDKPKTDK